MTNSNEHRRFSRIPFGAEAHLVNRDGRWHTSLIDISLKGALVARPAHWAAQVGDAFDLELHLDQGPAVIRMEGQVAHLEPNQVGLHCVHIDLESVSHLRRLVELNLGDTEQLNRELRALGTGK